ncbi:MAG: hypothetical protein ACXWWV_00775 [Candidatus Deferrimicrobiaceae bacterium]
MQATKQEVAHEKETINPQAPDNERLSHPSLPTSTYFDLLPFDMGNQNHQDAEDWAKQVLSQAGLPVNPAECYTIPDGKPKPDDGKEFWTLLDLVEARGFRKGKHIEWYAAAILRHLSFVRFIDWGIPTDRIGRPAPIAIRGRIQTRESLTKVGEATVGRRVGPEFFQGYPGVEEDGGEPS